MLFMKKFSTNQSFLDTYLKLPAVQIAFFKQHVPSKKLQRLATYAHRRDSQYKSFIYLGHYNGFSCFTDKSAAGTCSYKIVDPFDNKVIAEAEIEDFWLSHITVKSKYRRSGIGTSLIKFINRHTRKKLLIPAQAQGHMHRYYLSHEGAGLINSCRRKKILLDEQCFHEVPPITPTPSP